SSEQCWSSWPTWWSTSPTGSWIHASPSPERPAFRGLPGLVRPDVTHREHGCRWAHLKWRSPRTSAQSEVQTQMTTTARDPQTLLGRFDAVRGATETLAAPLSPEDQTVQSM